MLTLPVRPGNGTVALLTPGPGGPAASYPEASGRAAGRPAPQPTASSATSTASSTTMGTVQLPVAVCRNPTARGPVVATRYPAPWANADREAELTGSGARATVK